MENKASVFQQIVQYDVSSWRLAEIGATNVLQEEVEELFKCNRQAKYTTTTLVYKRMQLK